MVAVRVGATTQVPVMGMTVGLVAAKDRVLVIRVRLLLVRVMMEVMVLQVLVIGLEEAVVKGQQVKMVSLIITLLDEVAHRELVH